MHTAELGVKKRAVAAVEAMSGVYALQFAV